MRPASLEAIRAARDRLKNHKLGRLEGCQTLEDSLLAVFGPTFLERERDRHAGSKIAVRAVVLAVGKPPFSRVAPEHYAAACWPEVEPDLLALRWDLAGSLVTIQVLEVLRSNGLGLDIGAEFTIPCYAPTTSCFYFELSAEQAVYPQSELFAVLSGDPLCPSTVALGDIVVVGERGTPHWIQGGEALRRLYSADPLDTLAAQSGDRLPRSP